MLLWYTIELSRVVCVTEELALAVCFQAEAFD
jgi:hypothetical protein